MTRTAWGAGLTTIAGDGSTLDAWYRWLGWGEYGDDAMVAAHPELDAELGMRDQRDELRLHWQPHPALRPDHADDPDPPCGSPKSASRTPCSPRW